MDPTDPIGSRRFDPRGDTYRGLADASIEDFGVDAEAFANLSFNPVEHHERLVVGTLWSDAGREYESDGFSRRTLRTIVDDLENDGHRPGVVLVPFDGTDLFDSSRLYLRGEPTDVTLMKFQGWGVSELKTEGVLDGEAFVIAEDALTTPRYAPAQVLVRHPDAVAHYTFDP